MASSTLAATGYAFSGGGGGGGGSTVDVQDEGVAVNTASTLNFVGAGVTATDAGGGTATITIPGGSAFDRQLLNLPEAPADTVEFRGWAAFGCTLTQVRVYNATTNTQGTYTLTITNNATGNTVLNAASFSMNTLVANTVTALTLTATAADLAFSTDDRWTVSLASDNAGLDATGVYVSLLFEAT